MGGQQWPPIFFCIMEDINDNVKNLYIIRRKLAELKKGNASYFSYYVGKFKVAIWTDRILEHSSPDDDNIMKHSIVDVNLQEVHRKDNHQLYEYVELERDERFKNYQPIKYKEYSGMSNGQQMPINQLCELIKYLHRLSNLTAFM